MGVAALKKLTADWYGGWREVWRRDSDYHRPLDRSFFDARTAEVLWVLEDFPEDVLLRQIEEQPEHFEEIPALTHAQHPEIFREFFDGFDAEVQELCNPVSIGGSLEDYEFHFGESARRSWETFQDEVLHERATAWLKERGWNVEWSDGEED